MRNIKPPKPECACLSAAQTGKYRTQLWDKQTSSFLPSTPGLGMHVEIKDPDTKVKTRGFKKTPCHLNQYVKYVCFPFAQIILSRQYGSDGRFTFTSHTPGEHQICLHSNSTKMALFAGGTLVSRTVTGSSEIRCGTMITFKVIS